MNEPLLKISVSGIRGIVGEGLTVPAVCRFAAALGSWVGGGRVVVGRDSRPSGVAFAQTVSAGLVGTGCDVVDLGIVPVPTVGLAVERLRAKAGVMITASHNPIQWNGLKFLRSDGRFLNDAEVQAVIERYRSERFYAASFDRLGGVTQESGAAAWHQEAVLRLVDVEAIRRRRFRVAIDCCNGAGAVLTPSLLEALGCEVVPLHAEPNGRFPHPPEPVPANLGDLSAAVRKHRVDVGFAQDADADRLAIVSEQGEPIGEEYTLVLAASLLLEQTPGPVAVNLSTSRLIADVARARGVQVHRTKVGEVNVAEGMVRHGAVIGGEGNGGVIHPKLHYMRDSFIAMAMVLELLTRRRQPLSQIVDSLPRYVMVKRSVHCPQDQIAEALSRAKTLFAGATLDLQDGVWVGLPDGWVHVRGSNTEPLLRVIVEAPTSEQAEAYYHRVADALQLASLAKEV